MSVPQRDGKDLLGMLCWLIGAAVIVAFVSGTLMPLIMAALSAWVVCTAAAAMGGGRKGKRRR